MSKNERILLFLGRVQARIEDLGEWAVKNKNPMFDVISDFEHYFNTSIDEILLMDELGHEQERSHWNKGIRWNSLPR